MELMKVYLSTENGGNKDVLLPISTIELQNIVSLLIEEYDNDSIYISDYEYLIPRLSYEDEEQMGLVNEFTNVFDLNQELNNIINSYNSEAAVALLIADMMRKEDLNSVENINYYIQRFDPVKLDEDIFNYNPKYDRDYYLYILDVSHPNLSDTLSANNAEPYFDVMSFVKEMVLGDATVTSTGYLVWHF